MEKHSLSKGRGRKPYYKRKTAFPSLGPKKVGGIFKPMTEEVFCGEWLISPTQMYKWNYTLKKYEIIPE